jgi:flavorubredoxin
MINTTEVANRIYRISFWNEEDLAGILVPGATYNLFLIAADRPAIIETMFRRTFKRLYETIAKLLDPRTLRYIVIPHHEGGSSGAINEWLAAAPHAIAICSEICAVLSLRDFADKEPMVVSDGQVIDLGSHRLRFLITPQINQWDSLMVYEETTHTLFPNDLFSTMGAEIFTDQEISQEVLRAARDVGYQADDRVALNRALDKIEALKLRTIAPMHGPALTGHFKELIRCFRENSLASAAAAST